MYWMLTKRTTSCMAFPSRFTCSSEGLFQCRYTGLVFKMETAGEVQYRTESWNCTQLAHDGYAPAGPLFDIKCPQGTLSQLHFPHCEIVFGKGRKLLSVIHISDSGESEMLVPHETTDSYVVLNIAGCSKYGLTKSQPKKKIYPINCQVLLFLQETTLNVLLLPKNVDICEVCEKRKKMKAHGEEIYIETTSNCELVPKETYCLFSDPEEHEINPLKAKFLDYENYTNYIPAFQVFLNKLEKVKLNLKKEGMDETVWCSNLKFPVCWTGDSPSALYPSSPYTPPGQDFFHKHKAELETRLGLLRPILSGLEKCRVLNPQEREEVENKDGSMRNRTLLLMLQKKGGPAQEEFYRVLLECDEYLVKDLKRPHDYGTSEHPSLLRRDLNKSTQQEVAY
ncbi:caspase recruitment domain-containing protein 8 [Alosa pseudoharengus]|uniref:caspase recruitment domain-containing protein 8 n=1 Tax=Alosa pseudoharengus TaxID=34774 RepID=UPI003F8C6BD4